MNIPLRVLSFFARPRSFRQQISQIPRVLMYVAVVTIAAFAAAIAAVTDWAG